MISFFRNRPSIAFLQIFFLGLFITGLILSSHSPEKIETRVGERDLAYYNHTLQTSHFQYVLDSDPVEPKAKISIIEIEPDHDAKYDTTVNQNLRTRPMVKPE